MAGNKKFYGPVGYGHDVETPADSGVWKKVITEKQYFGDVQRSTLRLDDGSKVNPDLSVSRAISIIADPYLSENFFAILYVKWNGVYWTVDSVEEVPDAPRLLLRLGGVYNGNKAPTPSAPQGDSGS
jgi:hypothetical protein